MDDLSDDDYRRLLEVRTGIRRFERWSQQKAAEAGLTPAQHQLLLAVRGHAGEEGPTITDVAEYLQIQHHSVVGLIDRAADAGLCKRVADPHDARVVRLALTPAGRRRLRSLARAHYEELSRLGPQLQRLWEGLGGAPMQRDVMEPVE
jgi:DNA-binding MarR family transcriptional regulator